MKILSKSMETELDDVERDDIETGLNMLQKILDVEEFGFIPTNLPSFIDKNPLTTVELLKHIANTLNTSLKPYLEIFVNKEYKVEIRKSLEIIVRLNNFTLLPKDFLDLYISHNIDLIEEISVDTKNAEDKKKRQVRIFCIFVKSLITSNTLKFETNENQEILTILENFVVCYPHIKEAAGLFKILKEQQDNLSETM
jgi:hypothetical protein